MREPHPQKIAVDTACEGQIRTRRTILGGADAMYTSRLPHEAHHRSTAKATTVYEKSEHKNIFWRDLWMAQRERRCRSARQVVDAVAPCADMNSTYSNGASCLLPEPCAL